jgi:hypothetical protein
MVNHICEICNKCFNRKSNYDYHVNNKKNPCKINTQIIQNNPLEIKIIQNTDIKNTICILCSFAS